MASKDLHRLFRRCVQCPPDSPSCPVCPAGETCLLKAESCEACASTICIKDGSLPGQQTSKKSTPIGGIVGGVIGGLLVLAIIGYLLYRFRRRRSTVQTWDPPEKRDQSTLSRNGRQSTRSAHSIASTVLTRASNVIQIAYIPGVTVRSPPESPSLAVPPVPSLPGGTAPNSAHTTPHLEQHFFMPGDLRDSTWSDTSSVDPRISLAPSLARESVATTIYRSDAIVPPIPAQQVFRAQANMVSVKAASTASGGSTPNARTPQIPPVPKLGGLSGSSIVARTVTARPIEVKKTASGTRVPTLGNLAKEASRKSQGSRSATPPEPTAVPVYDDEKEVVVSTTALSTPSTILDESPISPVSLPKPAFVNTQDARASGSHQDKPTNGPTHRHTGSNGTNLNAIIENAINRARDPQHIGVTSPATRPEHSKHDSGPFSDANEVKENLP